MTTRSYTIWIIGSDGRHTEWTVPEAIIDGLRLDYPTLKIGNELRRMHLWSVRNASKRWREASVMVGVVRWLNRAKVAQARVLAEKSGHVIYGDPPIAKLAGPPGGPPPADVRAALERFKSGVRH